MAYSPPEAYFNDGWRQHPMVVDAWSLGIMLAELLAGHLFCWDDARGEVLGPGGLQLPRDQQQHTGWALVHELLQPDPSCRPTLHNALLSPYFTHGAAPPAEGRLATVYCAIQAVLAASRKSDEESVTLEMAREDDWPAFLRTILDTDVRRNWRVQIGGRDHKPFSWAATAAIVWVCDPANGMVEASMGSGHAIQVAAGGGKIAEWRAVGRLLAKCAVDCVDVSEGLGDVFFRYLGAGDSCRSLSVAMTLLAKPHPQRYIEWTALLARRLGRGSAALTKQSHPGCEGDDEPVSDANKREVVRHWVRYLLVQQRQEHLDAAHHEFISVCYVLQP